MLKIAPLVMMTMTMMKSKGKLQPFSSQIILVELHDVHIILCVVDGRPK